MIKKRKTLDKKNKFWKELVKYKRKDFNKKYKDSEVTLDQCIHHTETGYGDTSIVFKEDASDNEISKVLEEAENIL